MMDIFGKVKSLFRNGGGPEGSYRDAWGYGEQGSVFLADSLDGTGWQRNLHAHGHGRNTTFA
ncbi:MAG: hypothetical protein ACK5PF_05805, partial [bacterium]